MMAQPVPHHSDESQTTDKKRVKVYELRSNDWFDRGTGFCSASFIPVPEGQPREARVTVESEDQPNRLLLETKIIRDDGFQKQQETLIVWTENDVDMALSFQEPEGCAMIWKFVDSVQQTFHGGSGPDDGLSDDLALDMTSAIIQLPPPDLGVLPELESNMRIMSSTPNGRDALAKAIIKDDYIRKLIPLVEMAEDLESVHDLHRLCNIMKTIITLNDTNIMEHAVSDECILGVVGALEYDPDFPAHKANHRQWLSNEGRYKEVVKIQDNQIDRKIHQTYRLQYLKDVVLARCLDDPTFSVLNSLIFFNQVDIVQHLQSNASLLKELFAIFQNPAEDQRRKKEAVLFIQSCCAIAKNLQPPIRQTLYTNFLNHGLLPVINFGLRNIDVAARTGATDVLVSMIDHDPQMIRHTIYRQIQEGAAPLTDTLIDLLLVEVDLGIRSQISDALKVLLDPTPPPPPEAREFVAGQPQRARPMPAVDPQQELFLLHFYENSAPRLFKPLIELDRRVDMRANDPNDGIYSHLNDILCFNIRQHGHRSRAFVVNYNLAQRYNQLLSCKEKHLQLVAIKFFRQLVTVQDEFYIRHLTEKKVLGPVLDVLLRTLPRDNLLGSACLELFFLINKENVRELIKHLIDNYREKFQALAYLDTFRQMLNSYDNNQGYTVTIDPSFWELEDEMGQRPQSMGGRGMMEHLTVDSAQEDYWNTSDDEDDHPERGGPSHGPVTNGGPLKPLVEYTSDEETDENGDAVMDSSSAALSPDVDSFSAALSSGPVGPPERLSEKRRREEEDDDVLDKLVHHKRRNSSTSATSTSSNLSAAALRKKKGLGSRDSSPNGAGPKRISINISSSVKNAATALAVNAPGSGGEEEA